MRFVAADGTADQFEDFIGPRHHGDVDKTPLDLGPFGLRFPTRARGVLLEGLMQDADDDELTVHAGCGFGQLLE